MIKQSITVDRVLEVLNRALEADSEALHNLIETRVPCNEHLASDPDIQIGTYHRDPSQPTIGVLGLLNGFFGNYEGWGAITAIFELKCSEDSLHKIEDSQQFFKGCPECGSKVIIGNLTEFTKSPALNQASV